MINLVILIFGGMNEDLASTTKVISILNKISKINIRIPLTCKVKGYFN